MLVIFLVSGLGVILSILLLIFLILDYDEIENIHPVSITFTIFFDLIFGSFSVFIMAFGLKRLYKGITCKELLN